MKRLLSVMLALVMLCCSIAVFPVNAAAPAEELPHLPVPPKSVRVRNLRADRPVELCQKPALMPDTLFDLE